MKKATKILLLLSLCLILVGGLLFGGALTMAGWNWKVLSTSRYETVVHEIDEPVTAISVVVGTADVTLIPSEDGNVTVTGYEQVNLKNAVEVKDGTLTIKLVDTRKWYDHIGIHFEQPTVTVALPQGAYDALSLTLSTGDVMIPADFSFASILVKTSTGDVTCLASAEGDIKISTTTGDITCRASAEGDIKISTTTGDITVESVTSASLDLSTGTGEIEVTGADCNGDVTVKVTTGEAELSRVNCNNLTSTGNTGSLSMEKVIASGRLSVERTTGDVKFDGCDATEIFVKTDTGSVRGSLLSEKDFHTASSTGKILVPDTHTGGRCEITTTTGDIKIETKE